MSRLAGPVLLLLATSLFAGGVLGAINLGPWELQGIQASCNKNTSALPAYVLSVDDCNQCIVDAAATSAPNQGKMYACYDYCQGQGNNSQTAELLRIGGDTSNKAATDCMACVTNAKVLNAWGCYSCMINIPNDAQFFDDRENCYACIENDPYSGSKPEYFYACSQCAALASQSTRDFCVSCMTEVENNIANSTYSFGRCVAQAQQLQAMIDGTELPTGLHSQCFDQYRKAEITIAAKPSLVTDGYIYPTADCVACVQLALNNVSTAKKAYGCAQYCMDPTLVANAAEALQCHDCLTSGLYPIDPWACQNCMAVSPDIVIRQSCFDCLKNDPYQGNNSNYNWACGQCATLGDGSLRDACYQCIIQAGSPDQICECIDATVYMGVATDTTLDAFQKSCYSNWTIDVVFPGGVDLQVVYVHPKTQGQYPIDQAFITQNLGVQFAPLQVYGGLLPVSGDDCLGCMAFVNASTFAAIQAGEQGKVLDKRFACHQYCMDPTLILTEPQGQECISCIAAPEVQDAWACSNCLTISTQLGNYTGSLDNYVGQSITPSIVNETVRSACFDCVKADPHKWDAYAWGCGMCAQVTDPDAQKTCFACLKAGLVDPCQCVDAVSTGVDQPPTGPGVGQFCTAGQYRSTPTTCEDCPKDMTSLDNSTQGISDCFCIDSHNTTMNADHQCLCNQNSYMGPGSICVACPTGMVTLTNGATSSSACICPPGDANMVLVPTSPPSCYCKQDYYMAADNSACKPCSSVIKGSQSAEKSTMPSDCMCMKANTVAYNNSGNDACVCSNGYVNVSGVCTACPEGTMSTNGGPCECTGSGVFTNTDGTCNCTSPSFYVYNTTTNQGQCSTCPAGQMQDGSGGCKCPPGQTKNGKSCTCNGEGETLINGVCTTCPAGQVMAGDLCTCPDGLMTKSGADCLCPNGTYYMTKAHGNPFCQACPGGRTSPANSTSPSQCKCIAGSEDSNNNCVCDQDQYMQGDGTSNAACKPCTGGQKSHKGSVGVGACACPAGGLYNSVNETGVCACGPDHYLDNTTGVPACSACPTNSHSPAGSVGLDSCNCSGHDQLKLNKTATSFQCGCPADSYMSCSAAGAPPVTTCTCLSCPAGSTTNGQNGKSTSADCICKSPFTKMTGGPGMVQTDSGQTFCGCPENYYPYPTATAPTTCTACPTGMQSCPGSAVCGYPLYLEAQKENCINNETIDASSLAWCFKERAKSLPGYQSYCPAKYTSSGKCEANVTLIFDSLANVNKAAATFNTSNFVTAPYGAAGNKDLVGCANLPCNTVLHMSGFQIGDTIGQEYICNKADYQEVPTGYSSIIVLGDYPTGLCCTTCDSCPDHVWKYYGGTYVHRGYAGHCAAGCKECHGNCCADPGTDQGKGQCPTSSCPGNDLFWNDARANCVGSCESDYDLASGKCTSTGTTYTTTHGPCAVADASKGSPYNAFCDYSAYGNAPNQCVHGTPTQKPHCLGRIACRDSTGKTTSCPDAIKVYEGVDCFADGVSANYKICGASDSCTLTVPAGTYQTCSTCSDKGNPKKQDFCSGCQVEPWVYNYGGNTSTTTPVTSCSSGSANFADCYMSAGLVGNCASDVHGASCTNCHGNCCADNGYCPSSSCVNFNSAHANTNDLGDSELNCNMNTGITSTISSSSNNCPVVDPGTGNPKAYGAICDIRAYNPNCNTPHCLGRVVCVKSDSVRTRITCDPAIAAWEGVDCFMDGSSSNYKICACSAAPTKSGNVWNPPYSSMPDNSV